MFANLKAALLVGLALGMLAGCLLAMWVLWHAQAA